MPQHLGNLLQGQVLVRSLHIQEEVQVQSAALLRLAHAKHRVGATEYAALRFGVAAEGVLARVLAAVALWAFWTHPDNQIVETLSTGKMTILTLEYLTILGEFDKTNWTFW